MDECAGEWRAEQSGAEQSRAAACCPHQAPLRIFHREFTSLDTTGKLQEWRSNLSLLASVGSLFFSQVPSPERPSSLSGSGRAHAHTRTTSQKQENSSIRSRPDKRDLSFRSELPRPPNCVIEISGRSVIRYQRIPASSSHDANGVRSPPAPGGES